MRLRYDEDTMNRIKELVLLGRTNSEICEEFGVDEGYPSLCTKCGKMRKDLGLAPVRKRKGGDFSSSISADTNLVGLAHVGVIPTDNSCSNNTDLDDSSTDSSKFVSIINSVKSCLDTTNTFQEDVMHKLSSGFSDVELKMMENYSKQIKDIICKLENIQFLFDNIESIRKEQ